VYNGNAFTSAYTTTFLGSDASSATVAGMVTQTNAGTYTSSLGVSGAILDNYNTPVITDANLVISPKPVTVTKFDKSRGSRNQTTNLIEGTVGLIIDARGRPYNVELGTPGRIEALRSFLSAFGLPLPK
jgi:hypothetical protein